MTYDKSNINVKALIDKAKTREDVVTIEATVVTGFESIALDECREKVRPSDIFRSKGKLYFNITEDKFPLVVALRSVDNVGLVADTFKISFSQDKENGLHVLKSLVDKVDWNKWLKVWARMVHFEGILFPAGDPVLPLKKIELGESTSNVSSGEKTAKGDGVSTSSESVPVEDVTTQKFIQPSRTAECVSNVKEVPTLVLRSYSIAPQPEIQEENDGLYDTLPVKTLTETAEEITLQKATPEEVASPRASKVDVSPRKEQFALNAPSVVNNGKTVEEEPSMQASVPPTLVLRREKVEPTTIIAAPQAEIQDDDLYDTPSAKTDEVPPAQEAKGESPRSDHQESVTTPTSKVDASPCEELVILEDSSSAATKEEPPVQASVPPTLVLRREKIESDAESRSALVADLQREIQDDDLYDTPSAKTDEVPSVQEANTQSMEESPRSDDQESVTTPTSKVGVSPCEELVILKDSSSAATKEEPPVQASVPPTLVLRKEKVKPVAENESDVVAALQPKIQDEGDDLYDTPSAITEIPSAKEAQPQSADDSTAAHQEHSPNPKPEPPCEEKKMIEGTVPPLSSQVSNPEVQGRKDEVIREAGTPAVPTAGDAKSQLSLAQRQPDVQKKEIRPQEAQILADVPADKLPARNKNQMGRRGRKYTGKNKEGGNKEVESSTTDADSIDAVEGTAKRSADGKPKGNFRNYRRRPPARQVAKPPPKPYVDDGILKFRVTCNRSNKDLPFQSMDVARDFGGALNDKFHWTVDLTRFDVNVTVDINSSDDVTIILGLTKWSLHRRNIVAFSSVTLRATIAYNMIRFAQPTTGEIMMDPLCGSGAIPIEGAISFPGSYQICGDHNENQMKRTLQNLTHLNAFKSLKVDAFHWEVGHLPLRDHVIDVLVTDLPYGMKCTVAKGIASFYSTVLRECARVVKCGTGRAVLITASSSARALMKAVEYNKAYWREVDSRHINQGGMRAIVLLLIRKKDV